VRWATAPTVVADADQPLDPSVSPSPQLNAGIGHTVFLRGRVRRCMRERCTGGAIVAVDFYERTSVVAVARELKRRG